MQNICIILRGRGGGGWSPAFCQRRLSPAKRSIRHKLSHTRPVTAPPYRAHFRIIQGGVGAGVGQISDLVPVRLRSGGGQAAGMQGAPGAPSSSQIIQRINPRGG